MSKLNEKWKIGDKFAVPDPINGYEYPEIYKVELVSEKYINTTDSTGDELAFYDYEIQKIEEPVQEFSSEKLIIVNKKMPEYSVKINGTKEAVDDFFFGTRLADFYVIKNDKLIMIETSKDLKKLYEE